MPAADCTMRSAVQKDVFRMEQRNLRTRHQSAAQCTRRASAAACSHTRPSVPSPRRRSRASANSTHLNRTGDRTTDHAANTYTPQQRKTCNSRTCSHALSWPRSGQSLTWCADMRNIRAAEQRRPFPREARPQLTEGIVADTDETKGRPPDGTILAQRGYCREQQRRLGVGRQHEPRRARTERLVVHRAQAGDGGLGALCWLLIATQVDDKMKPLLHGCWRGGVRRRGVLMHHG